MLVLTDPTPTAPPKPTLGSPQAPAPPRLKQRGWHGLTTLYLPPDKNVAGFLAREVVVVLQDDLVCVPHYHSELISGRREGDKEGRRWGRGRRKGNPPEGEDTTWCLQSWDVWKRQGGRGAQAEGWAVEQQQSREKRGSPPPALGFPHRFGRFPYFFGFLGEISVAGPGAGISMGNMSTHISRRPCRVGEVQSAPRVPPCSQTP